MPHRFSISSNLAVKSETLWASVIKPVDINTEFRPLLKMTFPQGLDDVTEGWTPGEQQFRSWILLGGLLPVDYDDLVFELVEPGHYFLERSTMFSQVEWEHRRELTPLPDGTRLTDTVQFTPRLTALMPLCRWLFPWIFERRHSKLRRIYGQTGQPRRATGNAASGAMATNRGELDEL
jgi:hypothetical protein